MIFTRSAADKGEVPLPPSTAIAPPPSRREGWGSSTRSTLWQGSLSDLARMTADNWRETLRAYPLPPADALEVKTIEWTMALSRAGFLAGRTAVEALVAEDQAESIGYRRSAEAFAGWVAQNPEQAWNWLSDSPDEDLRSALLPRFTWKVSEAATEQAIDEFAKLPAANQATLAVATTLDLIQSAGYEAADDLLDRPFGDDEAPEAVDQTKQLIFDVLVDQRRSAVVNGGSLDEMCDWLGTHADQGYVRSEHFAEAASELAALKGRAAAADWLASLPDNTTSSATVDVLANHVEQWASGDSVGVAAWLENQRQHPAYARMAAAVESVPRSR